MRAGPHQGEDGAGLGLPLLAPDLEALQPVPEVGGLAVVAQTVEQRILQEAQLAVAQYFFVVHNVSFIRS